MSLGPSLSLFSSSFWRADLAADSAVMVTDMVTVALAL